MYSVCVDTDQSRLEQLELLLLIVNVNFQIVSGLQSIEIQHKIPCNLQSDSYLVIWVLDGLGLNTSLLVFLAVGFLKIY